MHRLLEGAQATLARQLALPLFQDSSETTVAQVPAPSSLSASALKEIQLGTRTLTYALKRSRRRTVGFTVSAEGLRVAAPLRMSLGHIEAALQSKQKWIETKLLEAQARQAAMPSLSWTDGATLPYFGVPITLRIEPAPHKTQPRFDAQQGLLHVAPTAMIDTKKHVLNWLQAEARREFNQRLEMYAAKLGVSYTSLRLSSAKTRWGSCTSSGKIALNWRLIHFPQATIDYVVVHELAHRREMNHSPRFWQIVEEILPEYQTQRRLLKKPPPHLLPRL